MFRKVREWCFRRFLHAIVGFALAACTTTGAHSNVRDLAVDPCYDAIGEGRTLVWSLEPEITATLSKWATRHGLTVVKHPEAREPVWDNRRQPIIPADEVLRNLAKSYGAQRVLVATAEKNAHPLTYRYAGYSEGPAWLTTVYDPIITIRNLGGREPLVYWTVIAGGSAPTFSWGPGLREIVEEALKQVEIHAEANGRKKERCATHNNDQ